VRRLAGDLHDEPADAMVAIGDPDALRATLPPSAGIVAGQLALRPGEDGVLARIAAMPILFVPPRLEAALALALAILGPVLAHLAGAVDQPATQAAPLARKLVSTVGLSEIALLQRASAAWEPVATGDLPLAALATADAWLTLEPGQEGYPAGHMVAARPL
jgi:molybdopterin biosynthesis enzyme